MTNGVMKVPLVWPFEFHWGTVPGAVAFTSIKHKTPNKHGKPYKTPGSAFQGHLVSHANINLTDMPEHTEIDWDTAMIFECGQSPTAVTTTRKSLWQIRKLSCSQVRLTPMSHLLRMGSAAIGA
jgi:hypothetical protein